MNRLNQHLRLSRRRANQFWWMQADTTTFPLTEQKDTAELRAQAAGIVKSENQEERSGNYGESTTGKPSDQATDRTDSAGQGETGQDTIHADGTTDNPIQPKPDRV